MWTTLIIANFNDLYAIHFYGGPTTTTTATLAWTTRRMRNNFTRLKRKNVVNLGFSKALHSRRAYRIANLIHNPTQSCQALAATRVGLSIYTLLRWRNIEIVCAAKRKNREERRRRKGEERRSCATRDPSPARQLVSYHKSSRRKLISRHLPPPFAQLSHLTTPGWAKKLTRF